MQLCFAMWSWRGRCGPGDTFTRNSLCCSGKITGWHFVPERGRHRLHQCLLYHGKSEKSLGRQPANLCYQTQTSPGGQKSDLMTAGPPPSVAIDNSIPWCFSVSWDWENLQISRCWNQTLSRLMNRHKTCAHPSEGFWTPNVHCDQRCEIWLGLLGNEKCNSSLDFHPI